MEIVVLGNGFDLANGLATRYGDFFAYRKKPFEKFVERFEELWTKEYPVSNDFPSDLATKYANKALINNAAQKTINAEIEREMTVLENYFMKELENIVKTTEGLGDITFWELYFYNHNQSLGRDKWCAIESEIKRVIMDPSLLNRILISSRALDDTAHSYSRYVDSSISDFLDFLEKFQKNILYEFPDKEKAYYLYSLVLKCKTNLPSNYEALHKKLKAESQSYTRNPLLESYHGVLRELLLKDLETFENIFRNYIQDIFLKITSNPLHSKQYFQNFAALVDNIPENYYILNFNYTSIQSTTDVNTVPANSEKDYIQGYNIVENNVHGQFSKKVIFGVDQLRKPASSNSRSYDHLDSSFIFTKTYRKMQDIDIICGYGLPDCSEVSAIHFYGHSLAEADYSYFQSLFDYYKLYSSSVVLVFYYNLFCDSAAENISHKKNEIDNVMKLLKTYGESFNNKTHGENLIHKLLLENRIKIIDISGKIHSIFKK